MRGGQSKENKETRRGTGEREQSKRDTGRNRGHQDAGTWGQSIWLETRSHCCQDCPQMALARWPCEGEMSPQTHLAFPSQASGCSPAPRPSASRLSEQLTAPLLTRLPQPGHQPWERHMRRPVLQHAAP